MENASAVRRGIATEVRRELGRGPVRLWVGLAKTGGVFGRVEEGMVATTSRNVIDWWVTGWYGHFPAARC